MKLLEFLRKKKDWFILVFLIAIFLALKISVLTSHFADGWIYFYFGKLVAEGATPYLDFYYSSPPLIPYLMGFLHAVFGFKLSFANLLPALFSAADAVLIFVMLRKKIGGFVWIAIIAYLFSFLNFATTDYFSEAHPLTTFALVGLLFFENRKFFWSGIFFGFAGLTKLYGILPAVFLPILLLREPKNLTRFLGGIFASFGIPILIFIAVARKEFLEMIFFNHLHKTAGIQKSNIFKFFLVHDFVFLAAAIPMLLAKNFRKLAVPLLAISALAIFYAFFADIYYLYLKVFVAIFVVALVFFAVGDFHKVSQGVVVNLILVLILTNSLFALQNYFTSQTQKARIENLPQIVAEVQKTESELYGDFEITPLVALLSQKNIFKNYVDTNEKFLNLGIVDSEQRVEELRAGGVRTILTKNFVGEKIYGLETLLPEKFFSENCVIQKSFPIKNDYEDNAVIVWSCEE
ncbi:DUF2029 domain-containing protein [Candidatus Gracilibacteria bacterium]|nr:DUF2029 domain-containing protein [Candidatus Gracilibacteria bacterium]MCF7856424.1 DUF2029 domain-containing protein [Candidatus Gracilibacteria bacterium]MCF7896297.1 DUF2029 domain-containing protein [Candidatus Gracilibacteria bacterium]